MIPLPITQMQTTLLRDRVDLRSYETLGRFKVFAEKYSSVVQPRMLSVSKRDDGRYYIAPGFFEGLLISGTGQTINLVKGQIGVLQHSVRRYIGSTAEIEEYFTGGFDVISAELKLFEDNAQIPDDEIIGLGNAYQYNEYKVLFPWDDSYLRSRQNWTRHYTF